MGCGNSTKQLRSSKSLKYQVKNQGFDQNRVSFFTTHQKKRAFRFREELYVEEQKIGSGSFADVYLYKNTNDDSLHALKILKDNTASKALLQECQMMKDVESQFVIRIEEFIKIDGQLCIMMEYANQGTLDNFLSSVQHQTVNINANQILDIVCDIFLGLDVMHTKQIIHRDLKMDNLLVSNYQIKIADLGVATYLISKSYAKTNIGNMLYAAPEKLNENESYNSASDIFSAGLIILQMILGLSNYEIIKFKINENYTDQIQDSPECLRDFIEELLNKNPRNRPTAINAFNLARKFKYNSEVLAYINNRINGALVQNLQNQNNQQASSQPFFGKQNIQLKPKGPNSGGKKKLENQYFQKGMQYYWEMDIESAEKQFSQILQQNPISVEGLVGKLLCGSEYQYWINKNKEYTKNWLQDQLTQIKELNPDHYMYYFCLGVINGDLDSMNKCIELRPSMAEAIAYKATLFTDQKNIQEAIKYGQIALEMSENSALVFRMLAYVYKDKNQDIQEKFYKRSLEINPNQYTVLFNLSRLFKKKNQLDQALEYINESLSICPFFQYSIHLKTDILQNQQQDNEIIEYIENIFLEDGEQDFLFFNLAYSYFEIRNFSQALLYYTKNLIYNKNHIATIYNMAVIYENLEDYEKDQEYYQIGIDKKDKRSYFKMFTLQKNHFNQAEKGIEYLNQMLKLEFDITDKSQCQIKLEALHYLKQYEEFLSFSEEALKKHPSFVGFSDQIKILLRDVNNQINLPQQFKLAEIIQSNQGINLGTLFGQLKYFKSNNREDLIVTHILKFYENSIHQEGDGIYITPNEFESFIDEDNLKDLYEGIQQIYENNRDNLYCLVIFICLISLKKLYFSDYMLEEINEVYKSNEIFKSDTNQQNIDYWRIQYKHHQLHYYLSWHEPKNVKNMFQNYIQYCQGASDDLKENHKDFFSLLSYDLNYAITNNDTLLQLKQNELDHYKKLLLSVKNEAFELFPNEIFNFK